MHKMDKVKVQSSVDKQKDDFFDSIPDFIDVDPGLVNLQSRRDPDCKDADVDAKDNNERPDLEPFRLSSVDHKDRNSVDDDLDEGLDLYTPKKD